ncbi:MAG: NUDIX domain-containing protein [Armatimonadetes bacterium]|nr:NUDIX domain-containing protein [Armatimonadota bacterium]
MTEWVDLVDLENRVVGRTSRADVRRNNLLHRGVGILCRNSRAEVYVHKRTDTKDVFPGMYDMFVGGVVGSGESYEEAAMREVEEELGIRGPTPEFLFEHLYQGDRNRSWIRVYDVTWDGPIVHQEDEIAWGGWIPESDLENWAAEHEIVPDGLDVFHAWLRLPR